MSLDLRVSRETTTYDCRPDRTTRGEIIASVVTPAPRDVWHALMQTDVDAVQYQSPELTQAACATGRYVDASRLYVTGSGARFVLPLLRPADRPRWACVAASMPPAWGIGGLLGSEPVTLPVLQAILDDLHGLGYLGVQIRPNPLHAELWAAASPGVTTPRRAHVVDLSGGFDDVWMRFSRHGRKIVRKAERSVDIQFDTTGRLLPVYYAMYEDSIQRWARKQHEPLELALWRAGRRDPIAKLERITDALGEACRIGVASINGQAVSSILVLEGQNANCIRSAMYADLIGNSGAGELLHKHAIEHAIKAGCGVYHLGESGNSTSLSRYKEKLGAVAYDYGDYRLETIPNIRMERAAKHIVKALIGFKDAT